MSQKRHFAEVLAFHPFTSIKYVTFSCFLLLKFRLEFGNANNGNILFMITEPSQTA